MSLTCKNCGGNISFDAKTNTITCESCGSSQSLNSITNASDTVYENDGKTSANINTYQRALNMMSNATTIDALKTAQLMFERIQGTLNAESLAKECREKIELMSIENQYQQALCDMNSEQPDTVISAQNTFNLLGEYKDSLQKSEECNELIQKAKSLQEINKAKERRQAAKRKRKISLICFVLIMVVTIAIFARSYVYSSKRYIVDIQPTKQNYLTEKGQNYEFLYEVEIENKGFLDVVAIECDVIIEKDDDVVADTNITYSNYSSVAVRAGKSNRFSWTLRTNSTYVAEELYYNFDELDIHVDITQIQFANGKIKTY